jgi:hypothetical protein
MKDCNQNSNDNESYITIDFFNSTENIFIKLSIGPENEFFELTDINEKLIKSFEKIFNKEFLLISTENLQKDDILINNSFVKFLKNSGENLHYKKVGIIFITYCDYFDLNYNKTFLLMNQKIQQLIKNSLKNMIGEKRFNNCKIKSNNGVNVPSLFDLIKK